MIDYEIQPIPHHYFNTLFWRIDVIYVRLRWKTENRYVKTKNKMKIEIRQFDSTCHNILIFHT